MIKVNINKDKKINSIEVRGHALYDDYGKDIVCASVSSIVTTTVNGLGKIDKCCIECIENKNGLNIKILKHSKVIDALLDNMIELLKELELNYKKYIKIK